MHELNKDGVRTARSTATLAATQARAPGAARYAIYYAPHHESAWWRFGCAWLGRDAVTGRDVTHLPLPLHDEPTIASMTALPRRYGFHATLKSPFKLASGRSARDVYLQAAHLAMSLNGITLPRLRLTEIDDFVALSFDYADALPAACQPIAALCVAGFDNLRARPDTAELARRQSRGLTPRQSQFLATWGYPYVFDEFRFHLTLTGPLPRSERLCVIAGLAPHVAELQSTPLRFDALSVYRQPASKAPFVVTRRYSFDGFTARPASSSTWSDRPVPARTASLPEPKKNVMKSNTYAFFPAM
jgi:putative phosphonate metabolism protein